MKTKASDSRIITIRAILEDQLLKLPIVCIRKNSVRGENSKRMRRFLLNNSVLGFTSHPSVHRSKTAEYVDAWCHCYKNTDGLFPQDKPKALISESDFVDPLYVSVLPRSKPKWDYFYFTGGGKQSRRKGLNVFAHMLPFLHKHKLRGIVVNYTRQDIDFFNDTKARNFWIKYSSDFKYHFGSLKPKELANLMSVCRFGLFPNTSDCSPLLLSESLIRDCPVVVNQDILGGWKYVNDKTGVFFDKSNISETFHKVLNNEYYPRDSFLSEFGFKKSASKLSKFINESFGIRSDFACFDGLSQFLRSIV